nr:uncharacterized protein LOC112001798 [Quercus suber]
MEDLAQRWKKMSLSVDEGNKVDLTAKKKAGEHVLAAKFMTHRNVNLEAVARTFRPLWRTRGSFEVNDAGNNKVLLDFELEEDVVKVLMGEPWTFDRHLVVLERYDGSTPIQNLQFKSTSFWVQIHDLPFSYMSTEVALSIGESLGAVSVPKDSLEMRGGNFMRVRVAVDITKALCRGRRVSWSSDSEGWVSFKYERLPNICYWCGQLSHDDKDCSHWLQSNGTLAVEDRQFGPWIRAAQFNYSKKTVVEVQGYEVSKHTVQNPNGSNQNEIPQRPPMVTGTGASQMMMGGHVVGQGGVAEVPDNGSHRAARAIPDFEEIIRDIDESLNAFSGNSNLNSVLDKDLENNEEIMLLDVPVVVADTTHLDGEWRKDKMGSGKYGEADSESEFQVGWTAGEKNKVGGRVGSNKWGEKSRGKTKQSHASVARTKDSHAQDVGPKKSTWARIPRPKSVSKSEGVMEGPKRKSSQLTEKVEEALVSVKKYRVEEDAVPVSMINQSISAEAAMQSRREQ